MNFFSATPLVNLTLKNIDGRRRKIVRMPNADPAEMFIFTKGDTISGTVEIGAPHGKKIEHQGVKIELIGQTELLAEMSGTAKFMAPVKILEQPGVMTSNKTYSFEFGHEKIYESYSGLNVKLRYFLRITVSRSYNNNHVREFDFAIENSSLEPEVNLPLDKIGQPIKMEVGIEECLHIEFEYDRSVYHLKDVILGKIYFLLVRIKIKHMELAVIRRESAGTANSSAYNDSENIVKYELMDGAPIKGECVPIRLFLEPLDLTPSYKSINNTFSVKYFLNLVLIDEEDRRYFKQQEVTLWRKDDADIEKTSTTQLVKDNI